jgi:hypothetical protein
MTESGRAGKGRETRLLLATIVVSVGVLLLLARFRFPEEAAHQTVEPAPAPLERLAARATYDELASIMADLERRVVPAITPLRAQNDTGQRYFPAVRVAPDRAIALLPRDYRLAPGASGAPPTIVLRDPSTELVVVQTPPRPEVVPASPAIVGRAGPRYVAVAEATANTIAVRPVYIGRMDPANDPRWPEPVLSVAAVQQTLSSGSAVFSLDGTFIGLTAETGATTILIPASTLRTLATSAPVLQTTRGDLAIDVQPLTSSLAKAAGAARGVMVSYVPPSVAAEAGLASGDVIVAVDGTPVTSVAGFQLVSQSRNPGTRVSLEVVRKGEPLKLTTTAVEAGSTGLSDDEQEFGADLRTVAGAGSEVVTVQSGTAAHRAGLRRGDMIVALDGRAHPDAALVRRTFQAAKPGQAMLVSIRRDDSHRVLALEKR